MKYKKLTFLLVIAILILALSCGLYFIFRHSPQIKNLKVNSNSLFAQEELPFAKGEKIIYNVNLFGIKIGEAHLQFLGKAKIADKDAHLIVLSTNVTNLHDVEKIYVDSATYMPLRVERKVVFFGRKIDIVGEYDHNKNLFILTETQGGKTTTKTISAESPMQNIISLIFLFRQSESFQLGQKIPVVMPLFKSEMQLSKIVDFNTANNRYKAYLFESVPSKYRIWIDTSPKKIPLRLDGAVAFGSTAMVMRQYIPGEN